MHKLREALEAVGHQLGLSETLRGKARRRSKKFRERAEANHDLQLVTQDRADKARANGHIALAEQLGHKAKRAKHRAEQSHYKAIYWRGRIKVHSQRIHKLTARKDELEAEAAKLERESGAHIDGQEAKGGSPKERWLLWWATAVANCANATRRNFYSMSGAWDIRRELVGGPKSNSRSDCSSTVAGGCKGTGLPDINGTNFTSGWTQTMLEQHNGWKIVSKAAMMIKGWGVVVYLRYPGDKTGHHTEAFTPALGASEQTSGHGSDPVDHSIIDLFGDGLYACLIHNS
jgi:hypothetical protein